MLSINLHVHFESASPKNNLKINTNICHVKMTLSSSLTYHLSDTSAIEQHQITKYNNDTKKIHIL